MPWKTIAPERLRIRLFGEPSFWIDDRRVAFDAPPKVLPLLTFLVVHRHALLDRRVVANALWPDVTEEEARANLRRHLLYLKKALPPAADLAGSIETSHKTIGWSPSASVFVDVEAFEAAADEPDRYAEAVRWYTGDLYAHCDEEWIFYERDRLKAVQAKMLASLVSRFYAEGSFHEAAEFATRSIALDPWREDTVRTLMSIRSDAGDRAGALAEYERFAERLGAELGVDPLAETRALYDALRAQASPPANVSARGPTPGLFGRDVEHETLRAAWDRSKQRGASLVLIGGEAGVGKSALLESFARTVEEEGARIVRGAARSLETRPYEPLIAALENGGDSTMDPEASDGRADVLSEFLRRFESLAAAGPALVSLEDLHWADEATAAVLEYIVGRSKAPLLFVATYRDDETPRMHPLRALRRATQVRRRLAHVALGGLEPSPMRELLRAEGILEDVVAEKIADRANGNPLFALELSHAPANGDEGAPESVGALVRSRLDALNSESRAMLQLAAVAGSTFTSEMIATVSGFDEAASQGSLDALIDRRFIRAGAVDLDEYAFRHDLIRGAVYATVPDAGKRRWHERIASYEIERFDSADRGAAYRIIAHLEAAGAGTRARRYYLIAGEAASAAYAFGEAVRYFSRALELAETPQQRVEALLARENAHRVAGNRDEHARDVQALGALVSETLDDDVRCDILLREIIRASWSQDDSAYRRFLESLERDDAVSARWRATVRLARAAYDLRTGDLSGARSALAAAVPAFEECGDRRSLFMARIIAAETALLHGDPIEPDLTEALALNDGRETMDTLFVRMQAARLREQAAVLKELAEIAAALLPDGGDIPAEPLGRAFFERHTALRERVLFFAAFSDGRIQDARRHLVLLERIIAAYGNPGEKLWVDLHVVNVQIWEGRYGEATAAIVPLREEARRSNRLFESIFALLLSASANVRSGNRDIAIRDASEMLQIVDRFEINAYKGDAHRYLAHALAANGDAAGASQHYEMAVNYELRWGSKGAAMRMLVFLLNTYAEIDNRAGIRGAADRLLALAREEGAAPLAHETLRDHLRKAIGVLAKDPLAQKLNGLLSQP